MTDSYVVTGATSEIGRAFISRIDPGSRVAVVGRRADAVACLQREFTALQVYPVTADLEQASEQERAAKQALASLGEVTHFVHLAGAWHDGATRYQGPVFWDTPFEQTRRVMVLAVDAPMRMAHVLVPSVIGTQGGMVFMSCGFAGPHEARGWVHYYGANHAIRHFAAGLAAELRPYHVRVNCIAPWFVATESVRRFYPEEAKRALSPMDVAMAIHLMLSPASAHVSGQTLELRSRDDT